MENDKYYTPKPEDLRLGYECEILNNPEAYFIPETTSKEYIKITVGFGVLADLNNIQKLLNDKQVRVPYLTKEDLTREGWNFKENKDFQPVVSFFEKDNYMMKVDFRQQVPFIHLMLKDVTLEERMDSPELFRVTMPVKSINEFRQLINNLSSPSKINK